MNSQRKPTTWQNPRQALSIFTMWACNRYRKNRILNPCTVYLSCVFVLLILKRSFQQRKNCISAVRALQSSGCGFWTSSNISYMFASLSDRLPRCCRRRPATSRSPWGKTWSSSGTCQQSSCGPSPPTCFLLSLASLAASVPTDIVTQCNEMVSRNPAIYSSITQYTTRQTVTMQRCNFTFTISTVALANNSA